MRVLAWIGFAIIMVLLTGCPKDDPPEPDSTVWELALRCADTLYRDTLSGHVANEMVLLRLIRDKSVVVSGVAVHCRGEISQDRVTQFTTTLSDTIAHVAGCNPALLYWGAGSPDTTVFERIHCWCLPEGTDTLRGSVQFRVLDPQ